jgi:hypothetical protein
VEGIARKTPYLRFDLNDYTIPHTHLGRPVEILATLERVRIVEGYQTLADHPRSFDRGQQIEDPTHLDALVAHKRAGRAHRALDRLHHAAPGSKGLFKLAAERGVHLGVLTRGLLHFIDQHLALRGAPPPIAVTING